MTLELLGILIIVLILLVMGRLYRREHSRYVEWRDYATQCQKIISYAAWNWYKTNGPENEDVNLVSFLLEDAPDGTVVPEHSYRPVAYECHCPWPANFIGGSEKLHYCKKCGAPMPKDKIHRSWCPDKPEGGSCECGATPTKSKG